MQRTALLRRFPQKRRFPGLARNRFEAANDVAPIGMAG
jgi:hypothetical protein